MQPTIESIQESGLAFVLFRTPHSEEINCYYQTNSRVNRTSDYTEKGFLFAPFKLQSNTIYIPATHHRIYEQPKVIPVLENKQELSLDNKEDFIASVQKSKRIISSGNLEKVVMSSTFTVNKSINPLDVFYRITSKNTHAFVYYWSHPETGSWIGATPERFVHLTDNKLTTMALAGTLPLEASVNDWSEKEYHEQDLVTQSIVSSLSKVVPRDTVVVGKLETMQAGNVQHLCTPIYMSTNQISLSKVIALLHPTPAVGGFPSDRAIEFIKATESYQREYYTGILGPFEGKTKADLYVNLRCGKITKSRVKIFAGAGITEGSSPEKEWDEICRKAEVFTEVL